MPSQVIRPALALVLALVAGLGAACAPGEDAAGRAGQAPAADAPGEAAAAPALPAGPLFVEVTAEAGLDFVHDNGMAGAFYMPENIGAGGALLDYDGDGDLDLYLVQGGVIGPGAPGVPGGLGAAGGRRGATDRLYRNDLAAPGGAVVFTDVSREARLPPALYGMGAATGDYDNDGWTDLYVTAFGRNRLLRNRGDGTFEDRTAAAGADDPRWSVPAVFFDLDADGWLDLFVGNYLDFTFDTHRPCRSLTGAPDYCSPSAYGPVADRLLHNHGDGTFEDVSEASGIGALAGKALGAVAGDWDGDGRMDLYVANDGTPNHLWLNRSAGGAVRFSEEALLAGCAVNAAGRSEASMGVDAGDWDGDGDDDLVMSHFTGETHTLFANLGGGLFEDVTAACGLGATTVEANGFGAVWLDVDNDGRLDLAVANGAVRAIEAQARAGEAYPYRQPNQLFHNRDGRLEEISAQGGEAFTRSEVSRGLLAGDLDQDGDTDLVVTTSNGPARLLVNAIGQDRPWLGVRAVLPVAGGRVRDAEGARVGLRLADGSRLWRRASSDGSYASARDPRALFGLAGRAAPEAVRIVWPDGSAEEWPAPPAGRYSTLRRGTGSAVER